MEISCKVSRLFTGTGFKQFKPVKNPISGRATSCTNTDDGIIINLSTSYRIAVKGTDKKIEKNRRLYFFISHDDIMDKEIIPRLNGKKVMISAKKIKVIE